MSRYSDIILNDTPEGYWRFNETSGTVAADSSGHGRNATYVNAPTLGVLGALAGDTDLAVELDGVSDWISIPANVAFDSAAFSIEFWVRPDTLATQMLMRKTSASYWRLFIQGGGAPLIEFDQQPGEIGNLRSGTLPAAGVWYHIVVTFDGTSARLYVNGVQSVPVAAAYNNTGNAVIEVGTLGGSTYTDGRIDELAIYSRALTVNEVLRHYNAGSVLYQTPQYTPPDFHFYLRDNASLDIEAELPMPNFVELYPRFNDVGRWRITAPLSGKIADTLKKGKGIVVVRNGVVILSGPVHFRRSIIRFQESNGDWQREVEVSGPDDNFYLAARLASPVPAGPPYGTSAYDSRTGVASTVIREYVDVNLGPSATAARRKTGLTLAADPVIGSSVTGNARFNVLIDLIRSLALAGGDLGFKTVQSLTANEIVFSVYQPVVRTSAFSVLAGTLREIEYAEDGGHGNYVVVAGSGEGTARSFYETGDSAAILDYERIEFFRDRRDTADAGELQQTADEELARNATRFVLNIVPVDAGTLVYPTGYNLGDSVPVDIVREVSPGVLEVDFTYQDIVREVSVVLDEKGETIRPVVGTPESRAIAFLQREKELERRVAGLEKR